MTPTDIIKNLGYSVVFGFMGFIIGIWSADLLYHLILHSAERTTASSISLVIIVLIVIASLAFGFIKGKVLLENQD